LNRGWSFLVNPCSELFLDTEKLSNKPALIYISLVQHFCSSVYFCPESLKKLCPKDEMDVTILWPNQYLVTGLTLWADLYPEAGDQWISLLPY
jgi:hypothetical protein